MIVYAGEEIVVHQNDGTSDFLLVTFCELHNEHLAHAHYFVMPLVEDANISCIGVMTTVKGFYLSPEIEHVARIVNEQRRGRKVIIFGQSMGAYAAIKYSGLLKADYVIACSPFFSMDPDDLEFPTERHKKVMMQSMSLHNVTDRPAFKGMAIKEADINGRVIVMYDPSDVVDAYDADLLRKHLSKVEFISVVHANHAIYNSSWRAPMFMALMRAVRDPDPRAFVNEMTRVRRSNAHFMVRSLRKAAYRHPGLCLAALGSKRVVENHEYRTILGDPLNMVLIYALFARGQREAAAKHFTLVAKEVMQLKLSPLDIGQGPLLETLSQHRCLLLSVHGTFLAYEMASRTVRLEQHVFKRTDLFPVFAKLTDGATGFHILSGDREIPIVLNGDGTGGGAVRIENPELVEGGANSVALRSGASYMGVNSAGRLQAAPAIGDSERFIPLPMPEQSGVMKASSLNWFDQVTLSQPPPLLIENDVAAMRTRRVPRWKRLFVKG